MNEVPRHRDNLSFFPNRQVLPRISQREMALEAVANRIGDQGLFKQLLIPEDSTTTVQEDQVLESMTPRERTELLHTAVTNSVFEDLGITAPYDDCPKRVKDIIAIQTKNRLELLRQTEADYLEVQRLMPHME